jgi:hypothetical protein
MASPSAARAFWRRLWRICSVEHIFALKVKRRPLDAQTGRLPRTLARACRFTNCRARTSPWLAGKKSHRQFSVLYGNPVIYDMSAIFVFSLIPMKYPMRLKTHCPATGFSLVEAKGGFEYPMHLKAHTLSLGCLFGSDLPRIFGNPRQIKFTVINSKIDASNFAAGSCGLALKGRRNRPRAGRARDDIGRRRRKFGGARRLLGTSINKVKRPYGFRHAR